MEEIKGGPPISMVRPLLPTLLTAILETCEGTTRPTRTIPPLQRITRLLLPLPLSLTTFLSQTTRISSRGIPMEQECLDQLFLLILGSRLVICLRLSQILHMLHSISHILSTLLMIPVDTLLIQRTVEQLCRIYKD